MWGSQITYTGVEQIIGKIFQETIQIEQEIEQERLDLTKNLKFYPEQVFYFLRNYKNENLPSQQVPNQKEILQYKNTQQQNIQYVENMTLNSLKSGFIIYEKLKLFMRDHAITNDCTNYIEGSCRFLLKNIQNVGLNYDTFLKIFMPKTNQSLKEQCLKRKIIYEQNSEQFLQIDPVIITILSEILRKESILFRSLEQKRLTLLNEWNFNPIVFFNKFDYKTKRFLDQSDIANIFLQNSQTMLDNNQYQVLLNRVLEIGGLGSENKASVISFEEFKSYLLPNLPFSLPSSPPRKKILSQQQQDQTTIIVVNENNEQNIQMPINFNQSAVEKVKQAKKGGGDGKQQDSEILSQKSVQEMITPLQILQSQKQNYNNNEFQQQDYQILTAVQQNFEDHKNQQYNSNFKIAKSQNKLQPKYKLKSSVQKQEDDELLKIVSQQLENMKKSQKSVEQNSLLINQPENQQQFEDLKKPKHSIFSNQNQQKKTDPFLEMQILEIQQQQMVQNQQQQQVVLSAMNQQFEDFKKSQIQQSSHQQIEASAVTQQFQQQELPQIIGKEPETIQSLKQQFEEYKRSKQHSKQPSQSSKIQQNFEQQFQFEQTPVDVSIIQNVDVNYDLIKSHAKYKILKVPKNQQIVKSTYSQKPKQIGIDSNQLNSNGVTIKFNQINPNLQKQNLIYSQFTSQEQNIPTRPKQNIFDNQEQQNQRQQQLQQKNNINGQGNQMNWILSFLEQQPIDIPSLVTPTTNFDQANRKFLEKGYFCGVVSEQQKQQQYQSQLQETNNNINQNNYLNSFHGSQIAQQNQQQFEIKIQNMSHSQQDYNFQKADMAQDNNLKIQQQMHVQQQANNKSNLDKSSQFQQIYQSQVQVQQQFQDSFKKSNKLQFSNDKSYQKI